MSEGYSLEHSPEIIQETPWSNVFRFRTSTGDVYLKQPAILLAQEAKVLQLLMHQFNACVPVVIVIQTCCANPFWRFQPSNVRQKTI